MQGDRIVIAYLNKVLSNELPAINQYFLHARMSKHRGLSTLHEHEYNESIDEMKRAGRLIDKVGHENCQLSRM